MGRVPQPWLVIKIVELHPSLRRCAVAPDQVAHPILHKRVPDGYACIRSGASAGHRVTTWIEAITTISVILIKRLLRGKRRFGISTVVGMIILARAGRPADQRDSQQGLGIRTAILLDEAIGRRIVWQRGGIPVGNV